MFRFALYEEKVPASQPDEEERKATDIEVVEATAEDNRIDSDDEDASEDDDEIFGATTMKKKLEKKTQPMTLELGRLP